MSPLVVFPLLNPSYCPSHFSSLSLRFNLSRRSAVPFSSHLVPSLPPPTMLRPGELPRLLTLHDASRAKCFIRRRGGCIIHDRRWKFGALFSCQTTKTRKKGGTKRRCREWRGGFIGTATVAIIVITLCEEQIQSGSQGSTKARGNHIGIQTKRAKHQ